MSCLVQGWQSTLRAYSTCYANCWISQRLVCGFDLWRGHWSCLWGSRVHPPSLSGVSQGASAQQAWCCARTVNQLRIKAPLLKIQVPQSSTLKSSPVPNKGSTLKSSGSPKFHIKVPLFKVLIKVQVPQGSISRFHINMSQKGLL